MDERGLTSAGRVDEEARRRGRRRAAGRARAETGWARLARRHMRGRRGRRGGIGTRPAAGRGRAGFGQRDGVVSSLRAPPGLCQNSVGFGGEEVRAVIRERPLVPVRGWNRG